MVFYPKQPRQRGEIHLMYFAVPPPDQNSLLQLVLALRPCQEVLQVQHTFLIQLVC